MEEGEEEDAHRCDRGPAVGGEQTVKLCQTAVIGQGPGGEVAHQDAGDYDLVGRETQHKRQQDKTVQTH